MTPHKRMRTPVEVKQEPNRWSKETESSIVSQIMAASKKIEASTRRGRPTGGIIIGDNPVLEKIFKDAGYTIVELNQKR